jgi:uncharacterized repeat protein (TIGR01451 family)
MSPSPSSPFVRSLIRACIALPVVAVLAGPTVSAAAATLDGTYGHGIVAPTMANEPAPAPAGGAQLTQGTTPTIAAGASGQVQMGLTQAGSSTAVPSTLGDVITITPPTNATISSTPPSSPGCPGGFAGWSAGTVSGTFTCTARANSGNWPLSLQFPLTPNAGTPAGPYSGGSVTLTNAAGNQLATLPISFNVSAPQITQTSVPTISANSSGSVPITMTQADGSTAVNAAAGDFITVTAPPNTKVTAFTCGASTTQTFAANGQSGVCTSTSAGAWTTTSRSISLTVNPGTPAGTYTGTMTLTNAAGTVVASKPFSIIVPLNAQMAQTSVPTINAGASGQAPMTLTQVDGATAVPAGVGDVITVTAPTNTTITGIPSCPGTVAIAANGQSATCTATTAGSWPTTLPATLQVNSKTAGGTFSNGTMTLTSAAGTKLASSPVAVTVPVSVVITQTSVPTVSAGTSGQAPMTMFQADGSTNVIGEAGDFITVTAPPNTQVTAFTCGAGTTQKFATNGSSGVCTGNSAGAWSINPRPISLTVNAGTPAGTYTGTMTYSNAAGTVLASSPVTIIVPGIHIVKTSNPPAPGPVVSGQVITYTLTLTNPGNAAISGATVTDALSKVVANTSAPFNMTASAGSPPTFAAATSTLTWTGTLPANNVPVTITYQVKVN